MEERSRLFSPSSRIGLESDQEGGMRESSRNTDSPRLAWEWVSGCVRKQGEVWLHCVDGKMETEVDLCS